MYRNSRIRPTARIPITSPAAEKLTDVQEKVPGPPGVAPPLVGSSSTDARPIPTAPSPSRARSSPPRRRVGGVVVPGDLDATVRTSADRREGGRSGGPLR